MKTKLLLALLALFAASLAPAAERIALLGTYTGDSRGIYAVRLDTETGALSAPELVAELSNPEFLALHPNGRIVYAVTRVPGEDGKVLGAVASFALDPASGKLTPLNVQSTGQGQLCHLAVDATGRMVVVASYGGGYVASFPLEADGRVGALATLLPHAGPLGPKTDRQNAPHVHSVTISPDNRFAYVADLGLDRVFAYRLVPESGRLVPHEPAFATIEPGAGPRHTKFSPDGKSFYVLNELNGTVTACRYEAGRGVVEPFQNVSTLPKDYVGKISTSEIRVHSTGRFVYAANRGNSTIAVFARDADTGALTQVEVVPCGGEIPRNFALSPDGGWLLCAHQDSNTLAVFEVDAVTGRLTATPHGAKVSKCVCVLFLP